MEKDREENQVAAGKLEELKLYEEAELSPCWRIRREKPCGSVLSP
jgi:hypothetical protein